MCGRYTLYSSGETIAAAFGLSRAPAPTPRYNIAPSQPVSAIASAKSGHREYRIFQWGLIPSWAKDPSIGNRMINARAETAAEKPSFRTAFKRRRCLVIADGFYEWKKTATTQTKSQAKSQLKGKTKGKKQPYYIQLADQALLGMAGLWEVWESGDGSYVESCTILTTEPNALMKTIHHRMPVILHPSDYDLWLDPTDSKGTQQGVQKREALQSLLRPYEADAMQMYPVSTTVNSPRNDSADCIEPAAV